MQIRRLARGVIPATVTLACVIASAAAFGQDDGGQAVSIKGDPVISTQGWNRFGIRNQKVQLSEDISYRDLNLATPAGANELKTRVRDAADAICRKLGRFDDDRGAIAAEADQIQCVDGAVDDAMAQVRRAIESEQTRGRG